MNDKILGSVKELFISKKGFDDRINQRELIVDTDGVFIDKFYGKNIDRSVLITSTNGYKLAKQNNIDVNYGQLGENIIVDFDLDILSVNKQLKIGEVILEITQLCTICNSLAKIDSNLPKLLEHDRGIFAKVMNSGIIRKNNNIELL